MNDLYFKIKFISELLFHKKIKYLLKKLTPECKNRAISFQ